MRLEAKQNSMKILYISHSIIPSRRANSVQVMKMCQAFSINGHQVTMLARTISEKEDKDIYRYYGVKPGFKIKTFFLPANRFWGLRMWGPSYGLRCWRFFSSLDDPSVLVYGRSYYGVYAATRKGLYSVYEVHEPPSHKLHYMLEKEIFKSPYFKRLVTISDALKKKYLKLFPFLEEDKILVAHDGADVPANENHQSREIVQWPGRQGSLQVGYVGSLHRGKSMELISALASLVEDADFHIVGGTENDLKHWKGKMRQKNIYFHGFVSHGRLDSYYRKFDIVLAPYLQKVSPSGGARDSAPWMSPLKIFEYMSFSKPIIASNLPVLKEILKNGENALLCDPEDIESWKVSILKLKESESLRRKLGSRAFEDLQSRHTWVKRARKVLLGFEKNLWGIGR